ncbi:hypothetical protein WJX72_011487 [[Myrmecia] bisecta]|uniref:MPN domain-containing protein n=1 Tax=[Myrmecia] bisecta TaxID=41462 RepID=A0AAW1PLA2_9CHLO
MAQNPDFKDLDELALEGGEENRDFSWEKHYPGDQGLQLQQRQRQQREEEQRRELQKSAESAYLSGEETEDEPAGPRPPVTATVSGLESGTESEGPRAMHASSSGLDISGPSAATASLPIATAGPAQGPWPYAQQAALNLGLGKAKVLATLPKPAPKKRAPTGKPRAGGGLSLKLLIDEGILWPGENVLSVEYKATMTYASLTEEGKILCKINGEPMSFDSPSAFSIYLKRLVNPSRKADDGWKTVKFAGKFLEQYKLELARRRYGNGAPGAASQAGSMATTASGASDGGASAGVSGWSGEDGPPAKKARLDSSLAKSQLKLKVPKPKSTTPKASFSLHRPEANGHILHGEQSEYARGRPKRQVKAPSRLGLNVEDPHQMVQPDKYSGTPGSGAAGAQPFRIEVSPAAQLMMDFHAHLNLNEIIGILGGTWHEEERVIRVHRAFPVRELQTEDDSINVEMDPEDEFAVREEIQQKHQLRCVGWYHSHPTFQTLPSIIDIHNQVTQQHAHRSEEAEPYVAAIVGPYDKRLADAQSSLAWFYVEHPRGKLPTPEQDPMQAGCTAMALEVTTVEDQARDAGLLNLPQGEMHQLAKRYADQPTRAEMRDVWKEGITNIEKLKASLVTRLPASWSQKLLREFFMKMEAVVMATWNVFAPQQRMAREAAQASDTEDEAEAAAVAHAREDEPEISDLTADADPKAGRNGDLDDTAGKAGRAAAGDDEEPEISGSTQEALDGGAKGRGPGPRRADVDEEMVDEELSVASSQATE